MSHRLAALALAAALVLPAPAWAQTSALTAEAAQGQLSSWGLSDITLNDEQGDHFDFKARDAAGRDIDVAVGVDGKVKQFAIGGSKRADSVDLFAMLPEVARMAADAHGIIDLTAFKAEREAYDIEGYAANGKYVAVRVQR